MNASRPRSECPGDAARTRLAGTLRLQAEACERVGSPLYAALLDHAAADVERGGPTWEVLHGHENDPVPSALALRLMGAVNRLVLSGDEPSLAAIYSDPDPDDLAAWQAFRSVLERNVTQLRQLIELPVQTNEVGRCAALLPGFLTVASKTGLPLRLLEVGASAGLNLRWDRYRYVSEDFVWGATDSGVRIEFELQGDVDFPVPAEIEIAERCGCDAAPIDPATIKGQLNLLAYVWPDQKDRIERLRAALGIAAELPVPVDREKAAGWVKEVLGGRSPHQATVLFNSFVLQYLDEEELAAFQRHLQEAGERATENEPLAWLRMEYGGEWADVRLSTWPGGVDRLIARAGYHGSPVILTGGVQS